MLSERASSTPQMICCHHGNLLGLFKPGLLKACSTTQSTPGGLARRLIASVPKVAFYGYPLRCLWP
jgi:hypothetical protein